MRDKFIKINDCILQKEEITLVMIEKNKVNIKMNNGSIVTNVTETEEEAQELFEAIWNLLN